MVAEQSKRGRAAWWMWVLTAIAVVVTTVAVWRSPVEVFLSSDEPNTLSCGMPFGKDRTVTLWPYSAEIQSWVSFGRDTGPESLMEATVGAFEQCAVARDHHQNALMLLAIGGATLLIVTRPRGRAGRP